MIRTIEIG